MKNLRKLFVFEILDGNIELLFIFIFWRNFFPGGLAGQVDMIFAGPVHGQGQRSLHIDPPEWS